MPYKTFRAVAAVAVMVLLLGALATHGQLNSNNDDTAVATLDSETKRFLDIVAAGDVDAALRELMTNSNLDPQSEGVRNLAAKAAALESKYGAFRGLERIDAQRVATDLVVLKYLYKCERYPVVWYFTYYRSSTAGAANGRWNVITVRFDTELELLAL